MNSGVIWFLCVAGGGAVGSVLRAAISSATAAAFKTSFPWATLLVNVIGSFLIGLFMAKMAGMPPGSTERWHALLVLGFCGGFTTFSTFSLQTLEQLNAGQFAGAALNVALSVGVCLFVVWAGYRLGLCR